jgi:uncharacterized membrane-anchored protein
MKSETKIMLRERTLMHKGQRLVSKSHHRGGKRAAELLYAGRNGYVFICTMSQFYQRGKG